MLRRITLLALATVVAFASYGWAASPADITKCIDKGTKKEVGKFVAKVYKRLQKCGKDVDLAKLPPLTDCNADALAEFGSNLPSTAYTGKLRKDLDVFHKKLAKACQGSDNAPYTADDVGLADIQPSSSGLVFHGWGAQIDLSENLTLLTQLHNQIPFTSSVENSLQEDCIALQPTNQWAALPPLQQLLDVYQCLAISEAKAQALKGLNTGSSVPALSVFKSRIVPVGPGSPGLNIRLDGGRDILPTFAPNGVNDSIAVPSSSACPKPGIGVCAANTGVVCSLAPGSGSDPANFGCPPYVPCGGCPLCVETATGPDGATAADTPTSTLSDGKCLVEAGSGKAVVKCVVEGVDNGGPVNTAFAGTCSGGPSDGLPCGDSSGCDTQTPSRYACLSGDEYYCQVHGIAGSNPDNSPPCGPCLSALVGGPPGSGCGLGAGGLCIVGTCIGGGRNGQACDITGILTCPGGFCNGVGGPAILTGDETGAFLPAFGGMEYSLCPYNFRYDFPMDLVDGVGTAVYDLRADPRNLCLPNAAALHPEGCFIHEAGSSTTDSIEWYTGGAGGSLKSDGKIPCPDVTFPWPAANSGRPTHTAVGPVIGISGVAP